jgi:hypothetical protein
MRIITKQKLDQIQSVINELSLLIENTDLEFVDDRRREIKQILKDCKNNYEWKPDEETNRIIVYGLLKLREKCKNISHNKIEKKKQYQKSIQTNEIKNRLRAKDDQKRDAAAAKLAPKINEGIGGTREENKKMRGQVWGEIRSRSKGL